jgi:serine/threonine-protein kinase HipA
MARHLQLFLDGQWTDCAVLEADATSADPSRLQYQVDYVFAHRAPVALGVPVAMDEIEWPGLPAFFYDLIPQGAGRAFLLGELGLPNAPSSDFSLACAGAFNPIGRVRIAEAVEYFRQHRERYPTGNDIEGMTQDEIVSRGADFAERMMLHGMLASGTTGVQGAAPKYLLTRDLDGRWHGDAVLPDERAMDHFIVKLPRGKHANDLKVLRNEAAYMRVAAEMGVRTHRAPELRGDTLFIPRFDREVRRGKVMRWHQESAASLAGYAGFEARPSLFELVDAVRAVVDDPEAETLEFLKRDILNLALRNTDNHARNTAVQVVDGRVALTPLFDFAPMYLDPEGIARVLRWLHPDTRRELGDWGEVMAVLHVPEAERQRLRVALARFGTRLEGLSECMRASGVDDDIIEFLQPNIATQVRQLKALAP